MTAGSAWYALLGGALALVGVGLATGVLNATLIRVLGLPSIIATLGMLSILQGISLLLREHPEGAISTEFASAMTKSVGFLPLAFIGVVVLAVVWDSGSTGAEADCPCARSASTRRRPAGSEGTRAE